MQIKNTENHFGLVAILFHWIMAVLIIGMLCVGLYMVSLPPNDEKIQLYTWHKQIGVLILMLVSLRLFWRIINITPRLSIPWIEKITARIVHWMFYGLMFAMPLTGWLLSSSVNKPPSFFGLFTLPNLIEPNPELTPIFGFLHEWFAYSLIALIILHILASFKHHFIDKDDILKRMIS